jgi:DNA-directed RNA polymerase delta subunit
MKYRELIKKVQKYSGFSDSESKDALDTILW